MSEHPAVLITPSRFLNLIADKEEQTATLFFEREDGHRLAVLIGQNGLQSLYSHIVHESNEGRLTFDLQMGK